MDCSPLPAWSVATSVARREGEALPGGAWQGESQAFSPGQVRTDSRVLSGAVHSRRFYRKVAQLVCADH